MPVVANSPRLLEFVAADAGYELLATAARGARWEEGDPDGIKVDERGNVFCTGPGGVWVISPEGEWLGLIEVPEIVANLTWGGPDRSTLYICATRSLYRVQTKTRGNRVPRMAAP